MAESTHYELRIIRYEDGRGTSKSAGLFAEVALGNTLQRTRIIKKDKSPNWDQAFTFSSSEASDTFSIRVKRKSRGPCSDRIIGRADITISQLLEDCACGEAKLSALSQTKKGSSSMVGNIHVYLKDVDVEERCGIDIENARRDIERVSASADKDESIGDRIASAVRKLDEVVKATDEAVKIHPYLNLTWQILSVIYKVVSHQFKQDQKLIDLVELMEKTFDFARDAKSLTDKTRKFERGFKDALDLTANCCRFVQEYTSHGFLERALKLSADRTISHYKESFNDLKEQIDSELALHVARRVEVIDMRQQLEGLRSILEPIKSDTSRLPRCLAGTRDKYLDVIRTWLTQDSEQNILWLNGIAGSGKSTVAATIMDHCDEIGRLASFLFFRRGKEEHCSIIRSVAYQLSAFNPSIAQHVAAAVEQLKNVTGTLPERQFEKLLLEPLNACSGVLKAPVVIILDALDECGVEQQRREILRLLRLEFSKLPFDFRFLITSRPENDIMKSLSRRDHIREIKLDHASEDARRDVDAFVNQEMQEIVTNKPDGYNWDDYKWNDTIKTLSNAANGLFIWASTVVKLVRSTDDPWGTLEELVADIRSFNRYGLDELYTTVLRQSGISWDSNKSVERFKKVIGLVLLGREALASDAIETFLGIEQGKVELTLGKLHSVLLADPGEPVRLHHASFADYLLSSDRCGDYPWFIDVESQKKHIALRCFHVMTGLLRFNICNIESSFIRNESTSDIKDRTRKHIPVHLKYACAYWGQHLGDVHFSLDLLGMLSDFAHRHLLFWFEVLSLVNRFYRVAGPTLLSAASWAGVHNTKLSSFLRDASKLAFDFAFPIAQSVPHIYISMLPLMREDSEVAAHYSKQLSSMAKIIRRGVKMPPMWKAVLEGHSDVVCSVSLSPDGKRIASASRDKTIRVWDFESKEEVFAPLSGHSLDLTSVCFSPDGSHLVSGSWDSTLRIWDAREGVLIIGPLERHTRPVFSVAYSPDGKRIASGSSDRTVIIWNAENGEIIAGPSEMHTGPIDSVAFSPDGEKVASASRDHTVVIWDVKKGRLAHESILRHSNWVRSIAFSPDGKNIATGSRDRRVRIWDVESGEVVSESLRHHVEGVLSVAYSSCGTRIVSGSLDKTVIVWDARTGKVLSGPLQGHADSVHSVTFTPDGKHIISGSGDRTVRVWDTISSEVGRTEHADHWAPVRCVAFSSDGNQVASASNDRTIIIWNARTGAIDVGPLVGHDEAVFCLTFSADGKRLISGSRDISIKVWDLSSGKAIATLIGHEDTVFCVKLSPDDTKLLSGSGDDTIRVWDMENGNCLFGPLRGHSNTVFSIVFSPDGKYIASGSGDKTIAIWDVKTWKVISTLTGHSERVLSVQFTADGTRIVSSSADFTIMIWDVLRSEMVAGPFRGHTDWVWSVLLSLDGRHLFSGSTDETIRVWSIETGKTICAPLKGHTSQVMSLSLSPDGTRIASGSMDNTIRVWDASAILKSSSERSEDDKSSVATFAADGLTDWALGETGWILSGHEQNNLLLWIPPDLRQTLWRPQNTALCCNFSIQLDFSDAAIGERWWTCFSSSESPDPA